MNKNYLVLGGVVLVLLVGGLGYAFKHQIKTLLMPEAPVMEKTTMEKAAEVDYSATGFLPATITVKKGSTVKFVNKGTGPMSVASNPHPTHTDYPGFDQWKSEFKDKSEYDFTFDKAGTWGYHNHVNPTDVGTVVVTQ